MATDGKFILYNPTFILSIPDEQARAEVAHEVSHCMFNHLTRRGGRDHRIWNFAADYVINLVLQKAGFRLGPDWLIDKKYDGMATEQVYELLIKNPPPKSVKFIPQDLLAPNAGEAEGTEKSGAASHLSPVEAKQMEREWQIAVVQTAIEAKRAGRVPGGLERFLDDLVHPKVPWRDALSRFLNQLTKNDYSWARPNRMFVSRGLFLPSLRDEASGHIAVVIDTSGSISQPVFTAFMTELVSIMAQVRPDKLTVVSADAAINHIDVFSRGEPIDVKMHGGGGTDFRPAIRHFHDDPPAALVYLTDLEGPCGEEPGFPVLWCCITDKVAPWGQTIKLELD